MSNAFMFYRCGSCADEKVIPLHLDRETIIGLDEFGNSQISFFISTPFQVVGTTPTIAFCRRMSAEIMCKFGDAAISGSSKISAVSTEHTSA